MFGWVMLGCGLIVLILAALIISAEEDTHERFYGNGKETGIGKDKQG